MKWWVYLTREGRVKAKRYKSSTHGTQVDELDDMAWERKIVDFDLITAPSLGRAKTEFKKLRKEAESEDNRL